MPAAFTGEKLVFKAHCSCKYLQQWRGADHPSLVNCQLGFMSFTEQILVVLLRIIPVPLFYGAKMQLVLRSFKK